MCILGPNLVVLDYFQGGGKTTEVMLVGLAERKLQRKQDQKTNLYVMTKPPEGTGSRFTP